LETKRNTADLKKQTTDLKKRKFKSKQINLTKQTKFVKSPSLKSLPKKRRLNKQTVCTLSKMCLSPKLLEESLAFLPKNKGN